MGMAQQKVPQTTTTSMVCLGGGVNFVGSQEGENMNRRTYQVPIAADIVGAQSPLFYRSSAEKPVEKREKDQLNQSAVLSLVPFPSRVFGTRARGGS